MMSTRMGVPEPHKEANRSQFTESRSEQSLAPATFDRMASIAQIVPLMPIFSLGVGVAFVAMYGLTGIWQLLGLAADATLSSMMFFLAGWLAFRKGHARTAAAIMLATTSIIIPGAAFFMSSAVVTLAVTTVSMMIILTTMLVQHRRGWVWGFGVMAGLSTWLWDALPVPWDRFDLNAYPMTSWGIRIFTGVAVLLLLVQIYRAYRRIRVVGLRLTVVFVALALLVAVAVSVSSILLSVQSVQEQVYRQLESSVVLKVDAVNTWIHQLQFVLNNMLVEQYEVQRAQSVLLQSLTEQYRIVADRELRVRLNGVIDDTQWFSEIFMIDRAGLVVLSTERALEGRSVAELDYYQQGVDRAFVAPPRIDSVTGEVSVVFARPLKVGNFTYGVLAARANLDEVNRIMASGVMGETGATHMVGSGNLLLTEPVADGTYQSVESLAVERAQALANPDLEPAPGENPEVLDTITPLGRDAYVNHKGRDVLGVYTWLPELSSVMVSEIDRVEVLAGARTTSYVNAGVALVAVMLAVVMGVYISRGISEPLAKLADTASGVANGTLDLVTAEQGLLETQRVTLDDEVGMLAAAFRAMTAQVRGLVGSLEERVDERTRGLRAVTEVSRVTTSLLDPDELLPRVVSLVQDRFALYYVGLFLLDEAEEYAVLRAGTGEAGAQMLAQGWRLRVDGGSMIGQSVTRGEEIVNQEAAGASDVLRFENPLLPDTRSELALPLHYGGRVIGAMTVQSDVPAAFDDASIVVFQNMADQVAVAVQNARLFAETSDALERAQRVQSRYQTQAWSAYLDSHVVQGYEYRGGEVVPLSIAPPVRGGDMPGRGVRTRSGITIGPEGELQVPIVQGGQSVGILGVKRQLSGEGRWTEADITLVEGLVEQLALAAENQRLLDETQRREAAERLTREVTARMQEPIELEDVLRTAADEIRRAFQSDWVVVRLDPELSSAVDPGQDSDNGSGPNGQNGGGVHE